MFINGGCMKLKLAVLGLFVLFSGVANASPWTGEKADGMYSDMTITNIHTGVVDFRPYFCIEAVR
ncbi:subtilase family AB5 toxin binding subunit, partial [Escherichia coli]|uniref:subtilase family AB5 toxin binding subunit n=1 Tax=Escherichia coli TaxID=562 RepID=UPI0035B5A289